MNRRNERVIMKEKILEKLNTVLAAVNTLPVQDIQHCRNKVYGMDILAQVIAEIQKAEFISVSNKEEGTE